MAPKFQRLLPRPALLACVAALGTSACQPSVEPQTDDAAPPIAEPDGTVSPQPDAEPDMEPDAQVGALHLRLPQAVSGAFQVNPEAYPAISLVVELLAESGDALLDDASPVVTVELAEETYSAERVSSDRYVALLPAASLPPGPHVVRAEAVLEGAATATVEAELVVATEGMQLTDFDEVGAAATPRLHVVTDAFGERALWVTWADRRDPDGARRAFLQQIDGAGRWLGTPTPLTPKDDDALYARAAITDDGKVCVLGQLEGGGPYHNRLWVSGMDGQALIPPVELNDGLYGSFGGDVVADGNECVAVYRLNDGQGEGGGEIRWVRVRSSLELLGPITAAEAHDGDGLGGFAPFSFLSAAVSDGVTAVAYVQEQYDDLLEMDIPAAFVVRLGEEGGRLGATELGTPIFFPWHHEARVGVIDDAFHVCWVESDLSSSENEPPKRLFAAPLDDDGDMMSPQSWVDAPGERAEIDLEQHGDKVVISWLDTRSSASAPGAGHVELRSRIVGPDGALSEERVFSHARFILGVSQPKIRSLDDNAVITWLDERTGGGILNPRPELYFETVWSERSLIRRARTGR